MRRYREHMPRLIRSFGRTSPYVTPTSSLSLTNLHSWKPNIPLIWGHRILDKVDVMGRHAIQCSTRALRVSATSRCSQASDGRTSKAWLTQSEPHRCHAHRSVVKVQCVSLFYRETSTENTSTFVIRRTAESLHWQNATKRLLLTGSLERCVVWI